MGFERGRILRLTPTAVTTKRRAPTSFYRQSRPSTERAPPGAVDSSDAATPANSRAADDTSAQRLGHQLWVMGTVWHTMSCRHRTPVVGLLGTGAGGGLYMLMKLCCSLHT